MCYYPKSIDFREHKYKYVVNLIKSSLAHQSMSVLSVKNEHLIEIKCFKYDINIFSS